MAGSKRPSCFHSLESSLLDRMLFLADIAPLVLSPPHDDDDDDDGGGGEGVMVAEEAELWAVPSSSCRFKLVCVAEAEAMVVEKAVDNEEADEKESEEAAPAPAPAPAEAEAAAAARKEEEEVDDAEHLESCAERTAIMWRARSLRQSQSTSMRAFKRRPKRSAL